jgi:hypothetical protein
VSELGELFGALREAGREKREKNRKATPEILREHVVEFTSHNGGAHLVVTHGGKVADLWPGTGKYNVRGSKAYRRGVFNLLCDLGLQVKMGAS